LYCIALVREITRNALIFCQTGDQRLCQSIGKVFLFGIVRKIF